MADVDNADILRIGAVWTLAGAYEVANVFHVRVTAGGSLGFSDASEDVSEYLEDLYDDLLTRLSDSMDTHHITLANVTQGTTYGAFNWTNPLVGTAAGDYTAPGVCLLTWARSIKPRVQSKKYWGVLGEASMTLGQWTVATADDAALCHIKHVTAFAGANGLTMLGVAYNRTLETYTDLTTVTYNREPAYQRRRRRGRGS